LYGLFFFGAGAIYTTLYVHADEARLQVTRHQALVRLLQGSNARLLQGQRASEPEQQA